MDDTPKKSVLRKTGSVLYRTILPFSAMRQSARLVKNEIAVHKENVNMLKEMGSEAKQALQAKKEKTASMTFAQAVGTNSKVIEDLYRGILRQKQYFLLFGALFIVFELLIAGIAVYKHDTSAIFFALISVVITFGLMFVAALGKQLRLWQLQTHRLSVDEQGGFDFFVKENPTWWILTLSPSSELKRGTHENAE